MTFMFDHLTQPRFENVAFEFLHPGGNLKQHNLIFNSRWEIFDFLCKCSFAKK